MRILTTILMLCLPMAAMGETFACTSTYGALINGDGIVIQGSDNLSYVVDTRRGLRVPTLDGVSQDYIGECEVSSIQNALNAFCTAQIRVFRHSIEVNKLTTGEIKFVSSSYFNSINGAYAGTCIEL